MSPSIAQIPEQKLDADPTLLGLTYEDATLGIRFAPPRAWPPIEPELMSQTLEAFDKIAQSQPDPQYVSRPVRMFYEKDRRYFMILANFPSWPAPVDPIAKMDEYRERVADKNPGTIIQYGMYRRGNMVFYHMLLTNKIVSNTRVIVIREGHTPVQIDYLVPVQLYDTTEKAVEASIGSIQPL